MRFGFVVTWADAAEIGELAHIAEQHGWDGLFVWEPVWGVDAWASLAVAATRTSTIRLGTMLTPPSRRRPWTLAGQVATVDRLSGGRVTLSVGLGAVDAGFDAFGEATDRRVRAELLDESLEIMTGLWRGQPFAFEGRHHHVSPTEFPTIGHTVQQPRVPIWCVGALGSERSMRRALRWDGLIPQVIDADGPRPATPDDIAANRSTFRADRPFDVVVEGGHTEHTVDEWEAAGATWWLDADWELVGAPDAVERAAAHLRAGPS
jgi:alkanesulfonate monooxygenase SsuD/methylene tetrahydromethanopterin reductase-like flavin-dependent oxidoreductase (luciferase family)